ncbi:MAG: aminotransferase class I/II-fold pyridoxal phosphate-dependent enzyme [Lachnospiraceae bacterium]|nr:aminotransferase class I/II-fold pyridoxal phosphate-dependent enzyme [Lachnospiraceae bacterium]
MEQPILNGLTSYHTEGCYPWHMPGHKRRLNTIFPEVVANPFLIDMTEVGELDEFHDPSGMIQKAWERAAEIYGSQRSYYLVNGATCGILASISAVCRHGDTLIVARNCHKSVYHAIRLLDLRPVYVMPEWNERWDMFGGVLTDSVKRAVKEHPEARAVVLVSPTYEGVVSDVERIARVVHKAGIPLIVDEAHGAHFEYMSNVNETISKVDYSRIPVPAIRLGADLVVESLHKTLPAMTQCAILHENSQLVSRERLEEFLSIYQSSSPSYVFLASMEACIEKMDHERDGRFILYKELLAEYRKGFGTLSHIHLMEREDFPKGGIAGYDEGKLVFSVRGCGWRQEDRVVPFTGTMLADMLQREYGQMMEMAGCSYILAMTSVADSKEAFAALYQAMESIDEQLTDCEEMTDTTLYRHLPEYRMGIREAMDAEKTEVSFMEAAGRVSGAFIYAYPPGIPIVAPGEVISREILKEIKKARETGLHIKGIVLRDELIISVVKEER